MAKPFVDPTLSTIQTIDPRCTWEEFVTMSPERQVEKLGGIVVDMVALKGVTYRDPDGGSTGRPCEYTTTGEVPACLIGHALKGVGFDITQLTASVQKERDIVDTVSWQALVFMQVMQGIQDQGLTWANAYLIARQTMYALMNTGRMEYAFLACPAWMFKI